MTVSNLIASAKPNAALQAKASAMRADLAYPEFSALAAIKPPFVPLTTIPAPTLQLLECHAPSTFIFIFPVVGGYHEHGSLCPGSGLSLCTPPSSRIAITYTVASLTAIKIA
ncbi:hypothetical protein Vadar_005854 [Vaccinium darrowii]|uniref:Uncharacterized protein n=1 Tax=Vaccinium darrowii TaxID=229202 RepID=A0ACB7YJA1_9ERIC|nr:hypothetical protein Vadar_005854 [Vaccinium darrowii]